MSEEIAAADNGAPSPSLAELAEMNGLVRQGVRPPFRQYLRDLWTARHFIWTLGLTRTYSRNENTYLGQVWAVINPLIFAGIYYMIFGVVLKQKGTVENFVGFLVIGVFVFQFCSAALVAGSTAVVGNMAMIRSLRFPRAALPISVAITELLTQLPTLVVMLVLVTITGEKPSFEWLALPLIFAMLTLFNVGVALWMSRLVHKFPDLRNLITHLTRVLRYISGVFFLMPVYHGMGALLMYQPYALSLQLMRAPLLAEFPIYWHHVLIMLGWALFASVGGIVYFWRGEGRYGLD